MPGGPHDFMVHGVKQDSSLMDFGPFNSLNQAQQFAQDQVASQNIVDYTISATGSNGERVDYDQT